MRLLCDEMLNRLGRWLRAAGYDTAIAEQGSDDRELLNRAVAEDRVLLTRDRHLAAIAPNRVRLVLLGHGSMDEDARVLRETLGIDGRNAPFTRCLVDNAPLDPAGPRQGEAVPAKALALGGPLRACPVCGRIYWPGSHVRRMEARLAAWMEPM